LGGPELTPVIVEGVLFLVAIASFAYILVILSWNYKRMIEGRYPEIDDYSLSASVGLGVVSLVIILLLQLIVAVVIGGYVREFVAG